MILKTILSNTRLVTRTVSRAAHDGKCRICGRTVLAGLDADRAAGMAELELTALTPVQEVAARFHDIWTYDVALRSGRVEIDGPRLGMVISGRPAGSRTRAVVMAEHRCHVIWPVLAKPLPLAGSGRRILPLRAPF